MIIIDMSISVREEDDAAGLETENRYSAQENRQNMRKLITLRLI